MSFFFFFPAAVQETVPTVCGTGNRRILSVRDPGLYDGFCSRGRHMVYTSGVYLYVMDCENIMHTKLYSCHILSLYAI